MIFKNYYTITIDEYCQLKENPRAILKWNIFCPKSFVIKAINNLYKEVSEKINKRAIDDEMYSASQLTHIEAMINLYVTIYRSMLLGTYTGVDKEIKRLFEKYFGGEYSDQRIDEIPTMISKLKAFRNIELEKKEANKDEKKHDLSVVVNKIGILVGFPIGNEKLFRLNHYIEQANEIIKLKEK